MRSTANWNIQVPEDTDNADVAGLCGRMADTMDTALTNGVSQAATAGSNAGQQAAQPYAAQASTSATNAAASATAAQGYATQARLTSLAIDMLLLGT